MKNFESEHNLVSGLKNQQSGIMTVIYQMYAYSLGGIIIKIVQNDELAEDLLQECFIKIWLNGANYNPEKGRLFTWMANIAKNLALDNYRIQARDKPRYIKLENTDWEAERILRVDGGQHESLSIKPLMDKLILRHKIPLIMNYLEGYSHSQIAEILDIPIGTVKTRIRSGLLEIRKNLANEFRILKNTAIEHKPS